MDWFKDRLELLQEAGSHRKALLTVGGIACVLLGTVDQLEAWGREAISRWITLPSHGETTVILNEPSWLWGITLAFFFLFLWMLETALKFHRALKPNLDAVFRPDNEGIVKTRTEIIGIDQNTGQPVKIRDDQAKYLRITLMALSRKPIRGCAVFLTKIEKKLIPTGQFIDVPVNGALSLTQVPVDVYPRVPATVDFLKTGSHDNALESTIPWPYRLEGVLDDKATYRFTMEAIGDDVGKTVCVEIDWSGKWDTITGRQVNP